MMNLDVHTIELIMLAIVNVILLAGSYWKMRNEVDKRPDYDRVRDMITSASIKESRVEEIIKRDAFPKYEGSALLTDIKNIKAQLDQISRKIDSYFTQERT